MGIPRIRIDRLNSYNIQVAETYTNDIPNVYIPSWMVTQPNVDYLLPPVVVNIGNPVIDIPGCVKAHKDKSHKKYTYSVPQMRITNTDIIKLCE